MQALRQIHIADTDRASVVVPRGFQHRRLEVIVIPVDDLPTQTWPPGFFDQTAGCFAESPLVRESQGTYEARDEVR
jgi:hypothetical protein